MIARRKPPSPPAVKPGSLRIQLPRADIVRAAIEVFSRLGAEAARVEDILEAAGVARRTFYKYFRDKEELLFEAVKDRIGGFEKQVLEEVTPAQEAMANLRQVVDACFFHATVSNHRRFIITLMVEALDTNPRLSAEFRRILRRMRAFLTAVVRRGQERGMLRDDVPAEAAAAVLVSGIIGAEVQHYQDPTEVDLRRVLDTLVEQLGAWLAPREVGASVRVRGGATAW